jgi:uncharacterized protein YktA (UPF0223 family)
MIIDVETDELIDVIDLFSEVEKNNYEKAHPDHYLLDDKVWEEDEDFDEDFENE